MLVVGITGGIGSGKSIVSQVLSSLGYSVFNSDETAKVLVNSDPKIKEDLIAEFGTEIYTGNILNRKRFAEIIFNNPSALEKANNAIHPQVQKAFELFVNDHKNESVVFNEAAILFETGSYDKFDKMILVVAPEELKISRLLKRDGSSLVEIKSRMNRQWSDERKSSLADFVINNNEKELLVPQIEAVLAKLN